MTREKKRKKHEKISLGQSRVLNVTRHVDVVNKIVLSPSIKSAECFACILLTVDWICRMELRTWISTSLSVVVWIRCSVHKAAVLLDVWLFHCFADCQICLFFFHHPPAVLLFSRIPFFGEGG